MTDTRAPEHPLLAATRAGLAQTVEVRRRLHAIPETGLQLPLTQQVLIEALEVIGLAARPGVTTTSVTARIEGGHPGPTVLLRADMDGLPLHEATGLEFASRHDGRMHACGHDTHMAMLLGAARLLVERRAGIHGRVLLMFQPGEEGYAGAKEMLDEGLLAEGPHGAGDVTRAFAIHISTRYPSGVVCMRPGPEMASADAVFMTVMGRGGHASAPHLALDPIPVAAELVLALQAAVTRTVDVFDPAVLTIAKIAGGTTHNIIPEAVELQGTIRCVSPERRTAMHELVRRVAEGVIAAHGAGLEFRIEPGYPVLVNDADVVADVTAIARGMLGEEGVLHLENPIMGAEDFAYVTESVPGAMVFLGAAEPGSDPATVPQNHSNRVIFHEDAMAVGAALYAAYALHVLGRPT
jgi:hippurate hydrolase